MNPIIVIVGQTEPLNFILNAGGSPIDLTDKIVTAIVRNAKGVIIPWAGSVTILNATSGSISLIPSSTDFNSTNKDMYLRFLVMPDGYYNPNGANPIHLQVIS